jgi:hypothetical protein
LKEHFPPFGFCVFDVNNRYLFMCVDVDRYMVSLYIHGWWNDLTNLEPLLSFCSRQKFRPCGRKFRSDAPGRSISAAPTLKLGGSRPEVPASGTGSFGQRNFHPTSGQVPETSILLADGSSMHFTLFRKLAGTWPELPVTRSSALVPPTLSTSAALE